MPSKSSNVSGPAPQSVGKSSIPEALLNGLPPDLQKLILSSAGSHQVKIAAEMMQYPCNLPPPQVMEAYQRIGLGNKVVEMAECSLKKQMEIRDIQIETARSVIRCNEENVRKNGQYQNFQIFYAGIGLGIACCISLVFAGLTVYCTLHQIWSGAWGFGVPSGVSLLAVLYKFTVLPRRGSPRK